VGVSVQGVWCEKGHEEEGGGEGRARWFTEQRLVERKPKQSTSTTTTTNTSS